MTLDPINASRITIYNTRHTKHSKTHFPKYRKHKNKNETFEKYKQD